MILVLGAGMTGLSLGHLLRQKGIPFRVLDASSRPGGNIHTVQDDGYLLEQGPNSLRMTRHLLQLVQDLGLQDRLVYTSPAAKKRFLLKDGRYRPMPLGPVSLLTGGFLGWKTIRRILRERKIPAGTEAGETVDAFFRRRFGGEVADYLVGPFVSGIFAGNAKELLLREAFPQLHAYETEYGSVLRGFFKGRDKTAPKGVFSFPEGLRELTSGMAQSIGDDLQLETKAMAIRPVGNGWEVETNQGMLQARQLVSTLPAHRLAPLLRSWAPKEAAALEQVHYPPVSVVHLGLDRAAIGHPLDGFGALNHQLKPRNTLGTIFVSSVFPGRAPEGKVLLTAMTGGAVRPEIAGLADSELVEAVLEDHRELLGLTGKPEFVRVVRWPRAIPQYDHRYPAARRAGEALEARGLLLGGNWYGGISVPSCLDKAHALCEQLAPSGG